jgi:hypothetical protein
MSTEVLGEQSDAEDVAETSSGFWYSGYVILDSGSGSYWRCYWTS